MNDLNNYKSVAIIQQFVPYHDARFNAAKKLIPIYVVEVFGTSPDAKWSRNTKRNFHYELLRLKRGTPFYSKNGVFNQIQKSLSSLGRENIDVVCIQGWVGIAQLSSLWWALNRGVPTVLFSESSEGDFRRNFLVEFIKSKIVSLYDSALVGSQIHIEYLNKLKFPTESVFCGYNVVDNDFFNQSVSRRMQYKTRYFLVVSRLIEEKNLFHVIDCYQEYLNSAKGDKWKLIIVGQGHLELELRELVKHRGLEEMIDMKGFCQYEDMIDIYAAAGALLHIPSVEPWGLVVNEATAAGLPVIVSTICGCSDSLIEDGYNGFVVEPTDKLATVNCMIKIAESPQLQVDLGGNSLKISERLTPEKFATGLFLAKRSALNKKTKKPLSSRVLLLFVLIVTIIKREKGRSF